MPSDIVVSYLKYRPLADHFGFGGSVGGAIPRERVRRLAAGRRSVRRRGVRGRVGEGLAPS